MQLTIRSGGAGEEGLLKRSAKGDCEMLDCEFIVVDGPYAKRKFWERMILSGVTDGHAKAADVSRSSCGRILKSARGIKPDDLSPQARAARTANLGDFDGLRFIAKIGIEKGKPKNDGSGDNYADKNILAAVITPDKKDWHAVEQSPASPNGGAAPTSGSSSPAARGHRKTGVGIMKTRTPIGQVSPAAIEDIWQRRATAAAIEAARKSNHRRRHSAWHADRSARRRRVGMDRCRHPVRLDLDARRTGNRRRPR